jgi:hypothetical protein
MALEHRQEALDDEPDSRRLLLSRFRPFHQQSEFRGRAYRDRHPRSFGSGRHIETTCGAFAATVSLEGVQPITRMRITHEHKNGGRFSVPLWLNVKVSFTPIGRVSREVLEIPVKVRFRANANHPWRSTPDASTTAGFVKVDTDGDRVADTYLPGTSTFIAGQALPDKPGAAFGKATQKWVCHDDGTEEQHCTWVAAHQDGPVYPARFHLRARSPR